MYQIWAKVRFHFADICIWEFPKHYDFISAWDSIWHVQLQQQLDVLRKMLSGLAPGGVLIFTTGGVESPEEIQISALVSPYIMQHQAYWRYCAHLKSRDAPAGIWNMINTRRITSMLLRKVPNNSL